MIPSLLKKAALAIALCAPAIGAQANPSGDWEMYYHQLSGVQYFILHIDQNGDQVSGTFAPQVKLVGTFSNGSIEAKTDEAGRKGTLAATVNGDEMKGQGADEDGPFTFTARRVRAPARPVTRQFTPTEFYNYFSSMTPPALHISPGDTVETKSVDAAGTDENGKRANRGGNPLTGPFYIDGAWPGDVIAVKVVRLRLNRDGAVSSGTIVSSALTPSYYRNAKFDDKFDSDWKIDRAAGVARLAQPSDRLKDFTVPLKPMLGCIGVAPPMDQSYRSGYLGAFGGNMDYNQFGEGVTIYLPVFQPGALLYLGDAHALQGDGELTGNALETSAEFTFSVTLVKNQGIPGPRAENAQSRMASGIANSLPDALAQATTNLARWLEQDFKLTPNEAAVVLGSSIHYDVAEVVDPLVHVVAKIDKASLAKIRP